MFFDAPDSVYSVSVDSASVKKVIKTDDYFEFELNQLTDSLNLKISKPAGVSGSFTLYGIVSESAPNGILYHSIGINGAQVPSFLRCDLFEQQLAALKPDLVILGLGINDAYSKKFSPEVYEENYTELIAGIRRAVPEAAIIFTTN